VVLPDSPRVSRVPGYSGNQPESLDFRLPGCHRLWRNFPEASTSPAIGNSVGGYRTPCCSHDPAAATPVGLTRQWFRLPPVRSPLLGGSRLLSLPRGTKMFQFPRLPPAISGSPPMTVVGLPHSGTPGSQPARGSPGRIVVRHALRRLSAPRHPPVALCSLITSNGSLWNATASRASRSSPAPQRRQSALVYTCKAFPFSCLQFSRCQLSPGVETPVCTGEVRLRGLKGTARWRRRSSMERPASQGSRIPEN
jgi:hypothetical protein